MNSSNRPFLSLRWLMLAPLCLIISAPFAPAQTAPTASAAAAPTDEKAKPIPVETTAAATTTTDKEIIQLSPFEVVADTRGYYSANTISGTRFNTKLDDLASSITVMTKGQMSDLAMLDINDVFLYVAGTEGTGTYTDYTLDRNGSLSDNVQINPTGANRIRGIAPANVSLGNIETMGRVPIDPINIDAIEISRGPNANVFGLGQPSGTVNMVPASANLTRDRLTTEVRGDNTDGFRTTLDVNKVLLKGKLAIRASGVYQHDGFERKPSGVDTERYNGMIKYQPFKNTTISGSFSTYKAYGNRPNDLPPRDNLSYWINSGRPTWDPVTQQIHNSDGTNRGAPVTAATYNGPDYFSAGYLGNDRSQMFIDQSGLSYWAAPRGTTSTAGPTLATLQAARYLQPTAVAGAVFSGTAPRPFGQYLFNTTPTISDKSIYDWSHINLSSPNYFWDDTKTTNFLVDQMIINTPMQTLAAQVAFMREDSKRYARNLVGIANDNGQSGQLTVDINERRLDGTPNPFFLRTYLSVDKPRTTFAPSKWDTSRAQLAYRLDLSDEKNLLKWLGWFQLTGYAEYKYRANRQYSYRDAMLPSAANPVSWIPAGTYTGYQANPTGLPAVINLTQGLYKFYVGDKVGNNVDYAPGNFSLGTYPFVWGNAATGSFRTDQIVLGQVAADKSGGSFNTKTTIRTLGGVAQNHLFGDRLVTTLGLRQDNVFTKFGYPGLPTNAFVNTDNQSFILPYIDGWAPTYFANGGRTTNVQFVVRPFYDTPAVANLNKGNSGSSFLGSLLNGLSFNANKSNSFLVTNPAQDLFQHLLPNPTGSDKSWGLGLNLFDGKLVVRATRYDNYQKDAQNGDASTMSQRVTRTDLLITGASPANPPINLVPNAIRWETARNPGLSASAINDIVATEVKLSLADQAVLTTPTPPIGTTNDIRSTGTEIEINVNPTKFWTITASATDTKSVNLNVSKTLADWITLRMPTWTTIVDPSWNTDATLWSAATVTADNNAGGNPNHLWWLHHYSATGQSPSENFQAFVGAPYGIIKALEGKLNQQVRRYAFRGATNFQLSGVTDNKWLKRINVGGALRWEDKGAIGYYGVQSLPAIITDLDPNRPIYDKAHYYVDGFVGYTTKLWNDKVEATFKFNVRNLGEKGRLQPIGAFPDGTIHTYRIVDPEAFIFSASFDM